MRTLGFKPYFLCLMYFAPSVSSLPHEIFPDEEEVLNLSQDTASTVPDRELKRTRLSWKQDSNKCKKLQLQHRLFGLYCVPRPVVMPFERKGLPSLHVEIHRCVGGCSSPQTTCQATKSETVCVEVENRHGQTVVERIANHTECACKCVKPVSCYGMFNSLTCSCECTDVQRASCNSNKHTFDSGTCTCNCKADPAECDYGTEWSPKECRCERKRKPVNA